MPTPFKLSVVAPDRTVVETQVVSLTVPGVEGYLGIWHGHVPLMAALKMGVLEYTDTANLTTSVAITGGFLEVSPDSVIVLADSAEFAGDIDLKEAEARLEQARRALRGEDSSMSTDDATEEIERSMTRIKLARRGGNA
jgi:F-type H+-transporting ATPase subunit epsilon